MKSKLEKKLKMLLAMKPGIKSIIPWMAAVISKLEDTCSGYIDTCDGADGIKNETQADRFIGAVFNHLTGLNFLFAELELIHEENFPLVDTFAEVDSGSIIQTLDWAEECSRVENKMRNILDGILKMKGINGETYIQDYYGPQTYVYCPSIYSALGSVYANVRKTLNAIEALTGEKVDTPAMVEDIIYSRIILDYRFNSHSHILEALFPIRSLYESAQIL